MKCCDDANRVLVDGKPLDEPYIYWLSGPPNAQEPLRPEVKVPEGTLWVMGDNRNDSSDSRYQGRGSIQGVVFPIDKVIGKARYTSKLESIPGWRAALSNDEMLAQLESVGAVICAAGDGLAPADKKRYALRDVTGTVPAIPLIATSIMSKKIAEGTGALVLDVKVGSGAFMETVEDAHELATTMVALGQDAGVHTVALLTDMSTPLGLTAGNAVEVQESLDVLAGGGPGDVVELTLALAREMLIGAGRDSVDPADKLADGSAMDVWRQMISAQGGDPSAPLPTARETHVVPARSSGTLTRLDALAVGLASWRLGAGRARKEDDVQAGAGVVWHARPGDAVTEGQPLFTLHSDEPERFERALASLEDGYDIGDAASYTASPLVIERLS